MQHHWLQKVYSIFWDPLLFSIVGFETFVVTQRETAISDCNKEFLIPLQKSMLGWPKVLKLTVQNIFKRRAISKNFLISPKYDLFAPSVAPLRRS